MFLLVLFRFNVFTGCPQAKTCTLIIRGGAEQFMEETERSLHDAIMIVRRAMKNDAVVAGVFLQKDCLTAANYVFQTFERPLVTFFFPFVKLN